MVGKAASGVWGPFLPGAGPAPHLLAPNKGALMARQEQPPGTAGLCTGHLRAALKK